jgi:2-phosphosulfolactate phosphatase
MMDFHRVTLDTCDQARGVVVVIDVLRAFTTAAYAFDAGAARMILVSTLEQAREIKSQSPGFLLTGEEGGRKPEGFDYGNSPQEIFGQDLAGATLIQRTSAGTQGVVRSTGASDLLAASLCCAQGTADVVKALNPGLVTFVLTGAGRDGFGDEDAACADYLESLLRGDPADQQQIRTRVRNSGWGSRFGDPLYPFLDIRDLEHCLQIDRFSFAMRVRTEGGQHIMWAETGSASSGQR